MLSWEEEHNSIEARRWLEGLNLSWRVYKALKCGLLSEDISLDRFITMGRIPGRLSRFRGIGPVAEVQFRDELCRMGIDARATRLEWAREMMLGPYDRNNRTLNRLIIIEQFRRDGLIDSNREFIMILREIMAQYKRESGIELTEADIMSMLTGTVQDIPRE